MYAIFSKKGPFDDDVFAIYKKRVYFCDSQECEILEILHYNSLWEKPCIECLVQMACSTSGHSNKWPMILWIQFDGLDIMIIVVHQSRKSVNLICGDQWVETL